MKQRMSRMVPFAVVIGAALALGAACATSDQTARPTPRRSVEGAFAANAGAGGATGAVNLALAMPIPEHVAGQSAEVVSGR